MVKAPALRSLVCAVALVSALATSGCATRTTASISGDAGQVETMSGARLDAEVRKAGASYERRPKDRKSGLTYAALLRMSGRNDQALAVMRKLVIHHPTDNGVLSAYAKALAAAGQLNEALEAIGRAQRPDRPDWRLLSAEGAILDQLERSPEARERYRNALDLAPGEPTVLSNLGMSYVLTNDLPTAESYLRKAAAQPAGDSRIAQNLALVVGLQGRFEEAERLAAADLPAEEATANITYLRQMLSQQNAWSQLKDVDGKPQDIASRAGTTERVVR